MATKVIRALAWAALLFAVVLVFIPVYVRYSNCGTIISPGQGWFACDYAVSQRRLLIAIIVIPAVALLLGVRKERNYVR